MILFWIDEPNQYAYWNDGSFVVSTPSLGTKVSWVGGDHSAITTDQPGIFESKWGPSPVFRHSYENCFFTDNNTRLSYYVKNCSLLGNETMNYSNRTIKTDATVRSCNDLNVRDVTVTDNAELKIEAPGSVKITGGFKVELGSELKIK